MRIFIPRLGCNLILQEDWAISLEDERRNTNFIEKYGANVTLPSGTILTVDRIYIRQGARNFDSITFRCQDPKGRFWVKIKDFNGLDCLIEESTTTYERHVIKGNRCYAVSTSKSGAITQFRNYNGVYAVFNSLLWKLLGEKADNYCWTYNGLRLLDNRNHKRYFEQLIHEHFKLKNWEEILNHLPKDCTYTVTNYDS